MIDYADFATLTDVQWRSSMEVERGLYIAEGAKTIERAIAAGHQLRSVITEPKWTGGLLKLGIPSELIHEHDVDDMERITGFHVHRGALAAFARPALPTPEALVAGMHRLLVIEDVVDHTNVGAIMRSAAAFDIDAVLLTPSCADPLYRRAIKVSMGAVFAVPWTRIAWPEGMQLLQDHGFRTIALTPDPSATDLRLLSDGLRADALAIILGTEGSGLSERAMRAADLRVRIPMAHGVDSLNVAAATAVACYELTR